jgi:SAM-dependent methyltransferase
MVTAERNITALWEGYRNITDSKDIKTSGLSGAASAPGEPFITEKLELLKNIPPATVRKAWFTLAHLVLDPGALVVDMGCDNGDMAYAMAVFNPNARFIGIDKSKRTINKARQTHKLPNLEFRVGDITKDIFEDSSVDAIVNSYIIYDIYSQSRFNERTVRQTLRNHAAMLKPGGVLFIHDYSRPPPEEFVLMEMPDVASRGEDLPSMSEADLLIWFSEHSRPSSRDPGCCGFYLEELPPRLPRTRLFRLPYKWAYEFIMRKDSRELWQDELPKEYTCFTKREFRKELRALGARVLYSTPHWDDSYIKKNFEGHFRLYNEDGTLIGWPATSFIAVAQKMGEGKSLVLEERRPSRDKNTGMRLFAMRSDHDGRIIDVVSRDYAFTNVIPYRINENGGLNVFVHEGLPRCIINSVPRQGQSLDGKRWSGHMIEALSIESELVSDAEKEGTKGIIKFANSTLGLKPAVGTVFDEGPSFYPAPDYIDERIETRYLRIESSSNKNIVNEHIAVDAEGFSSIGRMREVDAQSLLNAIAVGLVPNARLETQLLVLYQMLGIKAETWNECPLNIPPQEPEQLFSAQDLLKQLSGQDSRFKEVKGHSGQIRMLNSIFVDEGYTNGGPSGLVSKGMDFVVPGDDTVNTAVVLPLTSNLKGEIMAGVVTEFLPVPQRYKGNGTVMTVPSFPLPKEVTDMDMAAKYLAEKLSCKPDQIARLGESYFCHSGVTPQRIYPFAAANVGVANFMKTGRVHGPVSFSPMYNLWKMLYWDCSESFMYVTVRAYWTLCCETEATYNLGHEYSLQAQKSRPVSLRAEQVFSNQGADSPEAQEMISAGATNELSNWLARNAAAASLSEESDDDDGYSYSDEHYEHHDEPKPTNE